MTDLIISNGTIIDGTGRVRFRGDVAIAGDKIEFVGEAGTDETGNIPTIDATGLIVAPGFIDVHTHSDGWLLKEPHQVAKTMQGFTTEFLMLDGISYAPVDPHTVREWMTYLLPLNGLRLNEYQGWQSIGDYMALLDGNTAQNVAAFVPYANVRTLACGFGRFLLDDYQIRDVQWQIEKGLNEGALGLSTGLDYVDECFATTDELVAACLPLRDVDGIYSTHVRYKRGTLAGVQEAVEIGKRAGVAVHISHLKGTNEEEISELLHYIDTVAVNEVDFSFDVYPYVPSSTMLQYLLPYEIWDDGPLTAWARLRERRLRDRFARNLAYERLDKIRIAWLPSEANRQHIGKTLEAYVASTEKRAADGLADLLIEENMAVLLVFELGDDALVHPFLAHENYMMGSDGIYQPEGHVHPRQFGSAARLLGRCVRNYKLFSLEQAVRKLSGYPAERHGLTGRGTLTAGNFADVVLFGETAVSDTATYENPQQLAKGIDTVIVNGQLIVQEGQPVTALEEMPGRYLKRHP